MSRPPFRCLRVLAYLSHLNRAKFTPEPEGVGGGGWGTGAWSMFTWECKSNGSAIFWLMLLEIVHYMYLQKYFCTVFCSERNGGTFLTICWVPSFQCLIEGKLWGKINLCSKNHPGRLWKPLAIIQRFSKALLATEVAECQLGAFFRGIFT